MRVITKEEYYEDTDKEFINWESAIPEIDAFMEREFYNSIKIAKSLQNKAQEIIKNLRKREKAKDESKQKRDWL